MFINIQFSFSSKYRGQVGVCTFHLLGAGSGHMAAWPWEKRCVLFFGRSTYSARAWPSPRTVPTLWQLWKCLILKWNTESSHGGQHPMRVSQMCIDFKALTFLWELFVKAAKPNLSWHMPTINWSLLPELFEVLENLGSIWTFSSLKFREVGNAFSPTLRIFIWEVWWASSFHLSKRGLCWVE